MTNEIIQNNGAEEVEVDAQEADEADETSDAEETPEVLKKKIETLERQKNHWREKAKKPAETPTKKVEAKVVAEIPLSHKDTMALFRADVPDEDIEKVTEYAQFKKISVAEALATGVVKSILKESKEFRETAAATSKKPVRGGPQAKSDEQVLEDARNGIMPKPNTPEAEALFRARRGIKK